MPPTTHAADAADRLDPWGFGTTASDEPTALIEFTGLSDSDLDDLDADAALDDDANAAVLELVNRRAAPLPAAPSRPAPWSSIEAGSTSAPPPASTLAALPRPVVVSAVAPVTAVQVRGTPSPARPFSRDMAGVLALFTLVVLGQAIYIGLSLTGEVRASEAPTGELVLSSHPAGARVAIDGQDHGVTPLVASVPVGRHRVEVTGGSGAPQTLNAEVTAGATWKRHLVFAAAGPATLAALRIESAAEGTVVWLDGAAVGRTPLALRDLNAGAHTVRAQFPAGGAVERRVTLTAGETVAMVLEAPTVKTATPTGPASGWVSVQTPFAVQISEDGRGIGSSDSERILVTAGPHVFELANGALGFTTTMKVSVSAGHTAPLVVDAPRTAVQVNAQPWAEVLVDGRLVGETPLANVLLPIGPHQFVFRHPEFGEHAQPVIVRLNAPNRVTADLRK